MSAIPQDQRSSDRPRLYSNLRYTASGIPYITLPLGEPIYLTPIYQTDIPTLQETLSIQSLAENLISVPQPYTLSDAKFWVDLQLTGTCNLPIQVIRASHPETGPLIGSVALTSLASNAMEAFRDNMAKLHGKEGEYELGYYLHPGWTGKGIMTAAVREIVAWGRAQYDASVIVRVAEENQQSMKVVERFGEFVRDEEMDDWEDWPEIKGGGKRKVLLWRWQYRDA